MMLYPASIDALIHALTFGMGDGTGVNENGGYFFGDGSDGDFHSTDNVTIPVDQEDVTTVIKQYRSFVLNNHIYTVDKRCRGVIIYVQGDAVINGTIDLSNKAAVAPLEECLPLIFPIGPVTSLHPGKAVDPKAKFQLVPALIGGRGGRGGDGKAGNSSDYLVDTLGGKGGLGSPAGWFGGGRGGAGGGGGYYNSSTTKYYGGNAKDWIGPGDLGGNGGNSRSSAGNGNDAVGIGAAGGAGGSPGGGKGGSSINGGGASGGGGGRSDTLYWGKDGTNHGGGTLVLVVGGNLTINGTINLSGGDGQNGGDGYTNGSGGGGGGGGAGGGVFLALVKGKYENFGTINVNGGQPGQPGKNGYMPYKYHAAEAGQIGTIKVVQLP